MAVRIRNVALLQTAAPALHASITMCLASRSPLLLWCGTEQLLVYNDAAIAWLGDAHPAALGRTVPDELSERWRTIRSDLARAVEERAVVQTPEIVLTPVLDGEQVVAIAGTPVTADVELAIRERDEDDVEPARILVVEDDADMRQYLTTVLAPDWQIAEAHDGATALAAAANDRPDLIISDVRLPDVDGISLVRSLRSNPRTSQIPVILATAHTVDEVRASGLDAGADDYIVKPFTSKELRARVRLQLALARIRAEESRKAIRAKDDFLAMVGHELRNPLSTVSTMLQALLLRGPTREVELMERAVRQLTRLVDDLLESSRLSRGKVQLQKRPVELAQLVDRAIEHVSHMFEEKHHKVVVSVPRIGCRVEADHERLARAIANVLTNAAQHTPAGRRVIIDTSRDGERIRLRISDEGAGISSDRIGSVFQAFQSEAERSSGGLGLGLSIARNVIELHGGSITITSAGENQGTECLIELASTSQDAVDPSPQTRTTRRRLLLVEDNDDAARALKAALEQLGYEVALAHDAPIALNLTRTFRPDVALLDLGLPVMDGWELAKRMQSARAELPIVAVTARDQESDKQKSAELGFADHLVKPIDLPQLQKIVDELSASEREGT